MTNKRIMMRCCLPNGHHHVEIIKKLGTDLTLAFGGFTSYQMVGTWLNSHNDIEVERGRVYEVSMEPNILDKDRARLMFQRAAKDMGEIWVHIERHEFEALHTQVN